MQVTKIPADIVKDEEMEFLKDANERQKRQFVALIANRHGIHGVILVCSIIGINRKTVYRGRHELRAGEHLDGGRVRKKGGGRKSTLSVHPEYINIFREIVEFDIAGLSQDANTQWLRLTPQSGCDIIVRSRFNRFSSDGHPIWDKMLESDALCTYEMVVKRKGEPARTAHMELRWEGFEVKCLRRNPNKCPKTINVTCVYTREIPGTTPEGIEPVEWKLLTSHEVGNLEDAMRIISW